MEKPKLEENKEYFLDLDTPISSVTVQTPDGGRRVLVKDNNGKNKVEIFYDAKEKVAQIIEFSVDGQKQIFTDPEVLAQVDRQITGLLGEPVEEGSQE